MLFLVGTAVLAALLFSVYGDRQADTLVAGVPSPVSYVAPVNLQVVDEVATQQRRQAVREQVGDIYNVDARLQSLALGIIASASLPPQVRSFLLDQFERPAGVRATQLPELVRQAAALADVSETPALEAFLLRGLIPTSVPAPLLTEAARHAAADSVPPVLAVVSAGELIVMEGEPLTASQLTLLEATGLYSPRERAFTQAGWIVVGCLLLALLLCGALVYASGWMAPRLGTRQWIFITVVTALVLIGQRLVLDISPSFLFVMLIALVLSVLANQATAILWGVWAAIVVALLAPAGTEYTLVTGVVGAIAGARLAAMQKSRASIFTAAALAGGISALALVAMSLSLGGYTITATLLAAGYLILGGALAGLLSLALLPLAEHNFGFLTDFLLLELSNPSSPLLQRLLLEAPGTYQHSVIISNLVGQSVQRIGGNELLARVGALYHDVGKLKRPAFFVENQFSTDNPHDRLSPHLSYLIITAHVRDGVELLREYGLPRALEAFVSEHHGTTILSYFYKRALEDTPSLDELNFRYSGPKPRSKETAVLMLADAVESASRSITDAGPSGIREVIDRLVDQRLRDGQLAQSNLNFDDIEVIKETFERMLGAILHRRVAYPTSEEIGRLKRDGSRTGAGKVQQDRPRGKVRGLPRTQRMDS